MPALRRISRVGLTSVWSWSSTPVRHRSSISISRLSITVATFRERSWTLSLAWMYLAWDQIGFIEIMWCEEHRMAVKPNKKYLLANVPQSFHALESWKYITDTSADLQGLSSGAIFKWDKARTCSCMYDSCMNTNCVCDSCGDSLLPTSSAHTIIYFSYGPWGEDCRETTQPWSNNRTGPLLCVGGLGAWIGLCNTANSDIQQHWACSCVSVSENATW